MRGTKYDTISDIIVKKKTFQSVNHPVERKIVLIFHAYIHKIKFHLNF